MIAKVRYVQLQRTSANAVQNLPKSTSDAMMRCQKAVNDSEVDTESTVETQS